MARSVLVLQHVPWERPGILGEVLEAHSLQYTTRSFLYGEEPLRLDDISGLAVLGGPMNAIDYERRPRLRDEAALVRAVVDAGIPLLGVCLGQQIIATALGAKLHIGAADEVGMGTVNVVTDDPALGPAGSVNPVLHWHNDVVELPDGATLLASSDQTPNQAFRLGDSIFAMQFHIEVDKHMLERWMGVDEMFEELNPDVRETLPADFAAVASQMRETAERAFGGFATCVLEHD